METKKCKCCGEEKPIERFKRSRWGGHVDVCLDCDIKKRRANALKKLKDVEQNVLMKKLENFSARELMEELARRGYEGKLTITTTKTIDIQNV